jgi:hypothetical protein
VHQQPPSLEQFLRSKGKSPHCYIKPEWGVHVFDPTPTEAPKIEPGWQVIRLSLPANVCVPFHWTMKQMKIMDIVEGMVFVITHSQRHGIDMSELPNPAHPDNRNRRVINAQTPHALLTGPHGARIIITMDHPADPAIWSDEANSLIRS